MTTIINLYGGPGTGKSTSAALMFAYLKMAGVNAELVREYVKDEFVWEKRAIAPLDQFHFTGAQMRRESVLLGKVDVIVTHSPLLMGVMYSAPLLDQEISASVFAYYDIAKAAGHDVRHVLLKRSKPYSPAGRYQSEAEARECDVKIRRLLYYHCIECVELDTDERAIREYVRQFTPNVSIAEAWT